MLVERLFGEAVTKLISGEWLASFVKCVRERMCADVGRVLDGHVRMVFMKLGRISGEFIPSLDEFDEAWNVLRVWRAERCVQREQRADAFQEFGAQKKLLS